MSLVTDVLPILDSAQSLLSTLGMEPFTVVSRVEVYDKPLQHGAVMTGTESVVTISPTPRVEQLTGTLALAYGAGAVLQEKAGEATVTVYRISRITPAYSGGGYTLDQLVPTLTDATTKRHVVLLSGPGLKSGGEPFKVIDIIASDPMEIMLVVQRVESFA